MSITEEKKRRSTVIRKTYPDWYPMVSLGVGASGSAAEGGAVAESLIENTSIYNAPNFHRSLMIPRENMPQIAQADVPDFLNWIGAPSKEMTVDPNRLAPTQGQFDMDKVDGMSDDAAAKAVLTSRDDYVLDGHHRWLANAKRGNPQNIIVLPMSAKVALKKMNQYPGSLNKQLKEDFEDYFGQRRIGDVHAALAQSKVDSLSKPQTDALETYSLSSKELKKHLSKRKEDIQSGLLTRYGEHSYEKMAGDISGALKHFGALKEPLTVYTGVSGHTNPELINKFSSGIFHHSGFISSTPVFDVAKQFASEDGNGRHVIKFDLPAGSEHGAFIRGASKLPGENEFLIDHDKLIKISHKIGEHETPRGKIHVWQGHILSPDEASEHAEGNEFAQREIESHKSFKMKGLFEQLEHKPDIYYETEPSYEHNDEGEETDEESGTFVFAYDRNKKSSLGTDLTIGHLHVPHENVSSNSWHVGDVQVHPDYRRMGIATNMYKEMSKHLNAKPVASSIQSPKAKVMWEKFKERNIFESNKNESTMKNIHEEAFEVKRERMVKSLKSKADEFKSRYGEDWKSVMYATATKMAKKED